ncbi:Tyrosine recombinase XerC [termite gut metagenome]|uniref:Tyrosine recombinase XerC n=1 Tax=termite gut metagenome TaxID=433724 RepID=A0A5J4Q9X0_9ZZZZ
MRSTFTVLFYINKSKIKKNGKCPVFGRITVDGKVAQFSTGEEIEPGLWFAGEGCSNGRNKASKEINRRLEQYRADIDLHYNRQIERNGYVTAESLKNAIQGIGREEAMLLKEFLIWNEEIRQSIGITHTASTYRAYTVAYESLKRFVRSKYEPGDIAFNELDYSFIEDYVFYMKTNRGLAAKTVYTQIKFIKRLLQRAVHKEIISRHPFPDYIPDSSPVIRRWLSKEELDKIMGTSLQKKNMNFIRNLFIFASFTGLAYVDLYNLKHENMVTDRDGNKWIHQKRTKTGTEAHIPLLDIPLRILEKYRGTGKNGKVFNLPEYSVARRTLNLVKRECKLDKPFSFHMARHTWATLICLSNGISIETLSRMMGHRNISTTQIYAEATNQKIDEDMGLLEERIENKYSFLW